MKQIIYSEYSDTIRQMPENYMLACRRNGKFVVSRKLHTVDYAVNELWAKIRVWFFVLLGGVK